MTEREKFIAQKIAERQAELEATAPKPTPSKFSSFVKAVGSIIPKAQKSELGQKTKKDFRRIYQSRRAIQSSKPLTKKQAAQRRFIRTTVGGFVPIPAGARRETRTVQGARKGGRGRPKGAYSAKYAPYGGVFGYRKFKRAQEAFRKAKDAGAIPQQQPQQRHVQPSSFGGQTQPAPVDTRQIRSEVRYREVLDPFTGRKTLKRIPPKENWLR